MKSMKWGMASAWVLMAGICAAADLPQIVTKYEELALKQPLSGPALGKLIEYAREADATEAMLARWEERANAGEETYRVWEGRLLDFSQRADEARAAFKKATERSPGNALAWQAWGRFESGRNSAQARALLEKAVDLSRDTAGFDEAVDALAEDHIVHQRWKEAWTLLQKSWHQAAPMSRAKILARWTVVADQGERLAELAAELEQAWKDGQDRAIGLTQFYLAVGDKVQAWATILQARSQYPEDAEVRAQAIAVARQVNETSELARLWRDQVTHAPSAEARRELFLVLVRLGAPKEALQLCQTYPADFSEKSAAWHSLVSRFAQLGLASAMAETLKAGVGWEAAFVRAELLLVTGQREETEALLWSVLDPKWDADPLSTLTLSDETGALRGRSGIPGIALAVRAYQIPDGLPAPPAPRTIGSFSRPLLTLQAVQDARMLAIRFLAILAAERGEEERFLTRLDQAVATWPVEERLLAWAIIQNPERTLREIEVIASRERRVDEVDRFCTSCLSDLRNPGGTGIAIDPRVPELWTKFAEFRKQSVVGNSRLRESSYQPIVKIAGAFRQGDFEGVRKLYRETIEQWPTDQNRSSLVRPWDSIWNIVPSIPSFKKVPERNAEASLTALQMLTGLQKGMKTVWLFGQPEISSPPSLSGPPGLGVAIDRSLSPEASRLFVCPPPTLLNPAIANLVWNIFLAGRDPQMWPLLKAQLDAPLQEADPDWREMAPIVAAYFAWWYGDLEDAIARMEKILAKNDSVGGRRGLAFMLQKQLKVKEADEMLTAIRVPYPTYIHVVDEWRVDGAIAAKNTALIGELFKRNSPASVDEDKLYTWLTAMEVLKCEGERDVLLERLAQRALQEEERPRFARALNDLGRAGKRWDTVRIALANRALDEADDVANSVNEEASGMRSAAARTLKELGAFNDYVARLKKEKAEGGDAEILEARISDAEKETNKVREVWSKRALRPDTEREELRKRLTASTQAPGWIETFAALFLLEPEETLARCQGLTTRESSEGRTRLPMLYPGEVRGRSLPIADFEQAGQLPRLVEIIEQAPLGRRSRAGEKSLDDTFLRLAERCMAKGDRGLSLRVLQRATQVLVPIPPAIHRLRSTQLLAADEKEKAGQALLEYLAPQPATAPVLFAWGRERFTNALQGVAPRDYGRAKPARDDPADLKMAQALGVFPEVKARWNKAVAENRENSYRLLQIGIAERDESILPALQNLASTTKPVGNVTWVNLVMPELVEWPPARDICLQFISRQISGSEPDSIYKARRNMEVAQSAIKLGETEPMKQAIRQLLAVLYRDLLSAENESTLKIAAAAAAQAGDKTLLSEIYEMTAQIVERREDRRPVYYAPCLEMVGMALDRKQFDDANRLFDALKRRPQGQNDPSLLAPLAALRFEFETRQGDWHRAEPLVWLAPASSTAEKATIFWDLGIQPGQARFLPYPITLAEQPPEVLPKFTVDLLLEEEENSYHLLASLPNSSPRGVWRGALPALQGKLRAILRGGEQTLFGKSMPMAMGKTIWSFGQSENDVAVVPARQARTVEGGPMVDGRYLACPAALQDDNTGNKVAVGRAKIERGHRYVISGWLRSGVNPNLKMSWRALDAEGKEVGQGSVKEGNPQARFWNYYWQKLDASVPPKGPGTLPERAVEMELIVQDDGRGFDAAAWSVVQLPVEDNPKADTAE